MVDIEDKIAYPLNQVKALAAALECALEVDGMARGDLLEIAVLVREGVETVLEVVEAEAKRGKGA